MKIEKHVDPETNLEYESSWLARFICYFLPWFLVLTVMNYFRHPCLAGTIALTGLCLLMFHSSSMMARYCPAHLFLSEETRRFTHNVIVKWQHQRQKRTLTEQEWAGVPAGALDKPRLESPVAERAVSVAVTRKEDES